MLILVNQMTVTNYNSACHSTIKIKSADVTSKTYIDFSKENNKVDPKFKPSDHVRISKYKNIFAKVYILNQSEENFVIKKVEVDINGEETVGTFCENKFQNTNQKEFRMTK